MRHAHPDDAQLLSIADTQLVSADAAEHVRTCAECAARIEEYRSSLEQYARWHRECKSSLPPPPREWAPLTASNPKRRLRVSYWAAAAAATLLIAALLFRFRTEQTASAAELLEKASVRPVAASSDRRIRIRTREASLIRPAVWRGGSFESSRVRERFERAGFDWEEPLSARAFASWRKTLKNRDDRLRIANDRYEITTRTPDGALAEASITLRKPDLQPVSERLHFRDDEWIEITETVEPLPRAVAEPRPDRSSEPTVEKPATASEELHVIAILNRVGADLGEPVEVTRRAGRIEVSGAGVAAERQQEIRSALAKLGYVDLRFTDVAEARAGSGSTASQVSGGRNTDMHAILRDRLGAGASVDDFIAEVLDASELTLARAHAVRALAQRFPPDAQLSESDWNLLESIVREHVNKAATEVRRVGRLLEPISGAPPGGGLPAVTWHDAAGALVAAAIEFDRAASRAFASANADPPEQSLAVVRDALGRLQSRIGALERAWQ
jgi:hypothetical protein